MDGESGRDDHGEPGEVPVFQDVSPFWFLLFWIPAFAWLFISGVFALGLLLQDGGPSPDLWRMIVFAIPTIVLIRVPLIMDRPPRRFPAADLTLGVWGVVALSQAMLAEGGRWFSLRYWLLQLWSSFVPFGFMVVLYGLALFITLWAYTQDR